MANSVLKLTVDASEYDAKIKKAAEGLQQYAQKCHEAGGTMEYLDDGVLEFVQALGKMEAESTKSRQQLREMSNAITDLTSVYRGLTDAEKQSPFGQELASGIEEITKRASDIKDAISDVDASIKNAASDTRVFDQIAGAATGMTAAFQTVQGAAKLMGIQLGDNVEVLAKLQAAMAVTSGLQQLQQLLQKQSVLMQGINALQKEFNILAKANPYVLLATAAAAVATAYFAWANNAAKAEKAQKALNNELNHTKNQLDQIDKDTDFSVGIAQAAGKSWKYIHELRLEAARTQLQLADMNFDKLLAGGASKDLLTEAQSMQKKAWDNVMKVLNEGTIHDVQMRYGRGGGRSGGGSSVEQTEEQINSSKIEKLTQEYITASDERRQAIEKEIAVLQKRNDEIAKLKDMAMGKSFNAGELDNVVVTGNKNRQYGKIVSETNISAFIGNINKEIQDSEIGSNLYNKLTGNLADANAFKNLLELSINNGLSTAEFSADLWKKIVGGENIDDSVWQSLADQINEKLKELNIEPIQIDFKTGNVKKQSKEMSKDWKNAASAIQEVGSAMSQIEDPAAKIIGTVAQAVATIALGYAQATTQAAKLGPWAWIAFAATGLATMVSTISAIHSATGYVNGGMIKGNSYSGDNLMAQGPNGQLIGLNAGEIVLNKAQQGNLATSLESNNNNNARNSQPYVNGEQIFLGLTTYLKRSGRGELITSRR